MRTRGFRRVAVVIAVGILVLSSSCAHDSPELRLPDIDWRNRVIPAAACGTAEDVTLHDGHAFEGGPGFTGTFVRLEEPIQFGDFTGDGKDEAAVPIVCSSRNSSSPLLLYTVSHGQPALVGIIDTSQPDPPGNEFPFIDNSQTTMSQGRIDVSEMWYGPTDDDHCCPSIVARTAWTYDGTTLARGDTTTSPRTPPPVRPEDFIGGWRVHGSHLEVTSLARATNTIWNAGSCTSDPKVRCSLRLDLELVAAGDGQSVTATVVAVTYLTGGDRVVTAPEDAVTEIGDRFRLEFTYPGLLLATTIHTSDPTRPNPLGNPYLCGDHVAFEVGYACGA